MTGIKDGLNPEEARELMETSAFQQVAETATRGLTHGSRRAHVSCGSWQASFISKAKDTSAETPEELRKAMENLAAVVIFLPQTARVATEIIERICADSPLEKFIVWEID